MTAGRITHGQTFTISRRGLVLGINIAGERAWRIEVKNILRNYKKWKKDRKSFVVGRMDKAVTGSKNYNAFFHEDFIDIGCCRFYTEDIENISKLLKI